MTKVLLFRMYSRSRSTCRRSTGNVSVSNNGNANRNNWRTWCVGHGFAPYAYSRGRVYNTTRSLTFSVHHSQTAYTCSVSRGRVGGS